MNEYRLDLTLCLGSSLFEGQVLDTLVEVLNEYASSWVSDLHAWRYEGGRRDLYPRFAEGVRLMATERGDYFRQLEAKYGVGPHARRTGSVELRGADQSLVVVVELDDYVFAPSAGRYLWGNTITFQACARTLGDHSADEVIRHVAAQCCSLMKPFYAHAQLSEEWEAKNMSRGAGGTMAMGVDVSRYLPGLYWLNFFGQPYCDLIGKARLLGAPAHEACELGMGVLLITDEHPESSSTGTGKQRAVLAHIGEEYFFLRDDLERTTLVPPFGLEKLARNPRFT